MDEHCLDPARPLTTIGSIHFIYKYTEDTLIRSFKPSLRQAEQSQLSLRLISYKML